MRYATPFPVRLALLLTWLPLMPAIALAEAELKITLEDSATHQILPGLISISDSSGRLVEPEGLLNRGFGLIPTGAPEDAIHRWFILNEPTALELPAGEYEITSFSGLETELDRTVVNLKAGQKTDVVISLQRFFAARQQQLYAANTHLHLMKINREEADRYLKEVPMADGLDLVFLSYLERAGADVTYISNQYQQADLERLSLEGSTHFGNGEEHRHNLREYGQGFGHVMLLDLQKLIQPVSIGASIMKSGDDFPNLQRGIDTARNDGATIIWCHNEYGLEDIPNLFTGRIDAVNIHDGGRKSNYDASFYRYLEAGLKVPFSTGTDWFQFDFSRVYVPLSSPPIDTTDFVDAWLGQLKAGRSFITNGPVLAFSVDGYTSGDEIALTESGKLKVKSTAHCRQDFGKLEVVVNGEVVHHQTATSVDGHFVAEIDFDYEVSEPAWIAVRTPPLPVDESALVQVAFPRNELGQQLYAHTSPVYVTINGKSRFNRSMVRELIEDVKESRRTLLKLGRFPDEAGRAAVLDIYQEGIERLENSLADPSQ